MLQDPNYKSLINRACRSACRISIGPQISPNRQKNVHTREWDPPSSHPTKGYGFEGGVGLAEPKVNPFFPSLHVSTSGQA